MSVKENVEKTEELREEVETTEIKPVTGEVEVVKTKKLKLKPKAKKALKIAGIIVGGLTLFGLGKVLGRKSAEDEVEFDDSEIKNLMESVEQGPETDIEIIEGEDEVIIREFKK